MKFSTLLASAGLMFLGSISINASAQSSVCSWNSVYSYTSSGFSYTSYICRIGGTTVVASRTDSYAINGNGQHNCGSPSVSTGYHNTGIPEGTSYPARCNTVIVTANTPSSSSPVSSVANVCYTGEYQIIQTSPTPYPTFNPSFCGPQPQCKHSVTSLDQHSYPRLKYTCL